MGLTAARLCGAGAAALRRRTVLVCYGIQLSFGTLAQVVSSLRRPTSSITAVVREQAKEIARILREWGIAPNRLGIDGVPGSGKSTLARTLAEELGMKWKSLDYRNLRVPGNLDQDGTIYEHHRLLRIQDVDVFDAIVYADEPVERSRAKVRRRGRGLVLALLLDYDKLREVGKLAFDVCDGSPVAVPSSDLVLKVRPPEGFRAMENAAGRLGAAGVDASGLSKEAMLFLLACGERREGLKAYFLPPGRHVARMGRAAAKLRSAVISRLFQQG